MFYLNVVVVQLLLLLLLSGVMASASS